jgi:23S rRNA (adenine-N6)-dimethyltransferase
VARMHSHGARSRPDLSQHFFRDPALVRNLVAGLPLKPFDLVVEIGAGDGIITEALAGLGCRVIAIEKDLRLYLSLRRRFLGRTNVQCWHADFLTFRLPTVPYSVVSNVPFSVTAAVVRRLLGARPPPVDGFLVVQREAAEKFAGTPRETLFSLLNKPWFEISIMRLLRRDDFVPPPSVDCALIRFHRREQPIVTRASRRAYRGFVRAMFGRRGPNVYRALRGAFSARQVKRLSRELGFSAHSRPSDLSFDRWMALFRFYERVHLEAKGSGSVGDEHDSRVLAGEGHAAVVR